MNYNNINMNEKNNSGLFTSKKRPSCPTWLLVRSGRNCRASRLKRGPSGATRPRRPSSFRPRASRARSTLTRLARVRPWVWRDMAGGVCGVPSGRASSIRSGMRPTWSSRISTDLSTASRTCTRAAFRRRRSLVASASLDGASRAVMAGLLAGVVIRVVNTSSGLFEVPVFFVGCRE